jgi:hypothetical protein
VGAAFALGAFLAQVWTLQVEREGWQRFTSALMMRSPLTMTTSALPLASP